MSYRKFVWLLFLIGLPMLMLTLFWYTVFNLPGGIMTIILFSGEKGGDFAVHVAGAFVFLTLLADLLVPPPPSQSLRFFSQPPSQRSSGPKAAPLGDSSLSSPEALCF
jgi:hypothetical protein